MTNKSVKIFILILLGLTFTSVRSFAQFKEEAFNQSYVDAADSTAKKDSIDQVWSFKQFFRGVAHKDSLKIGTMFAGSTVFIGAGQIYNRQYWKLPIIYGGIGTTIGLGIHYNNQFKSSQKAYDSAFALDPNTSLTVDNHAKDMATYMFASAGLIYWGSLMDETINFNRGVKHQAGKATLYSILVPGLGQAYNGEYWKIPIYWSLMVGSFHFYQSNNKNYKRYKRIHNEASNPEVAYEGKISEQTALYYRDVYRRYRDYSVVAMVGSYLLQVIDANVFAYMQDFEVSDDLSVKVTPSVISPYSEYAAVPSYGGSNAFGLKVGFTF